MRATKLKRWQGLTVAEYTQARRMRRAEILPIDADFTMGRIARMIGCSTSSRFAELIKRSTGRLEQER